MNRATPLWLVLCLLWPTLGTANEEQSWEPTGFVKQTAIVQAPDEPDFKPFTGDHAARFPWTGISSMRLGLRLYPDNGILVDAALDAAFIEGDLAQQAADQLGEALGFKLLPPGEQAQIVKTFSGTVSIQRASFQIRRGLFTTLIGLAPFSQGNTLFFNPADIINNFQLTTFEDEKAAFWQIGEALEWGDGNEIFLSLFPGAGRDKTRYLFRSGTSLLGADLNAFVSRIPGLLPSTVPQNGVAQSWWTDPQWLVGIGGWRPVWEALSLRFDLVRYFTGLFRYRNRLAVGLDYQGPWTSNIVVEYLYDETGAGDKDNYLWGRLNEGYLWTLARHYATVYLTVQPTLLDTYAAYWMQNMVDGSARWYLAWTRSLAQDLDLRLGVLGVSGAWRSEFGKQPGMLMGELKMYY